MENSLAIFDLVKPIEYDKPANNNYQQRYYLNGKPMIQREKVLSLAELRAEAKKRGFKKYYRMPKEKLRELLNK